MFLNAENGVEVQAGETVDLTAWLSASAIFSADVELFASFVREDGAVVVEVAVGNIANPQGGNKQPIEVLVPHQ